jgi:hypothetical protein
MYKTVSFFGLSLLLATFAISMSNAQSTKIKWEDAEGREFSISAPQGEFSYGMISGDNVSYDPFGRVTKVGSVMISYDPFDRVTKVGSVMISYDPFDRVTKVGGLSISYDALGRITGTRGRVNW